MKKKLKLSNITLLAATSIEIDMTQLALRISLRNIEFGAVKLLSSLPPSKKYSNIEYVSIPSMNFLDYSRLIIEDLHKYFETSHCLIVQADSFVVNSDLWKDEFLDFSKDIATKLSEKNIRVDIDDRNESIGKRIREAEKEWIRYILVIGEKEANSDNLSVRDRNTSDVRNLSFDEFIDEINEFTTDKPFSKRNMPLLLSKRPIIQV